MPRLTRTALVLALVLSGCTGARRAAGPDTALAGTWVGSADQYDSGTVAGTPDSRWAVEVTLGPDARVAYPSLGCSGTLTYRGGSDAGGFVYTETITRGQDRCIPTGTVTLTPDGAGLRYDYGAGGDGAPSVAVARLSRR